MNILYCVPFWANITTVYLFREIAAMRDRGHKVAVLSMSRHEDGWSNVESFGIQDIPVFQHQRQYQSDASLLGNLFKLPFQGLFTSPGRSLRSCMREAGMRQGLHDWVWNKRAVSFVRSFQPDVIDAFWASDAAAMARRIHDVTGIPYTVTLLGGDVYRAPSPGLQYMLEKASGVFPLSIYLQRLLLGELKPEGLPRVPEVDFDHAKLRLRPLTLPREYIATEPADQSAESVTIACIARLAPEKRQEDLIEAVARLKKQHPNVRAQFIGDGPRRQELESLARQLGVEDHIEFAGLKTTPEICDLLKRAQIYCQPSQVEGFCLAALEGASQGLPAVATRTGAHESIVQDSETGFLYDAGDVDALEMQLRKLLDDRALRSTMGEAALDHVRRNFCFEEYILTMESRFEAIKNKQALPHG